MKYNYVARVEEPFALFDQLYDKPWLRIGPYLVGMIVGYLLFKKDCKIHMNAFVVIVGWILSLACLGSLVYGLGRDGLVVPASAFYVSITILGANTISPDISGNIVFCSVFYYMIWEVTYWNSWKNVII